MPTPTAAAQPLPSASDPQQTASSPIAPAESPAGPTSAATVPATPAYNAITVQLQPSEKTTSWTDPAVVAAFVPALALIVAIITTNKSLKAGRENLDWQLTAARDAAAAQLPAARENLDRQLAAGRDAAAAQLKEARADAQADREHALQKEIDARLAESRTKVFTELIDNLKEAQSVIGSLGTRNPNKEREMGAPVANLTASVNKVWLFAGTDTVLETRELLAQTMETFLDGMAHCMPIYKNMHSLEQVEESIRYLLEDRKEAVLRQRDFRRQQNENGIQPAANLAEEAALDAAIARAANGVREGRNHRQEIINANGLLQKNYVAWLSPRQEALMSRLNDVLKCARVELGVPGRMEEIDLQTVDMLRRFQRAMAKILAL